MGKNNFSKRFDSGEKKIGYLTSMVKERYPKLAYHNADHGLDVWRRAKSYAIEAGVGYEDRFVLESAALLHDVIVVPGAKDNELKSVEFSEGYLDGLGYSAEQIKSVGQLILATIMPQNPKGLLGELICDADLDNLGRKDFFKKGELLSKELGMNHDLDFLKFSLNFIEGHKYHTEVVRKARDAGKLKNIAELKNMIKNYKGK